MNKLNKLLMLSVISASVVNATAQSSDGSGVGVTGERKAGSVNIGGVFVTPTVDVLVGSNNNVTAAPSNGARISSSVLSVRPGLTADIERSGDKYQASYFGKFDRYASSAADNANDHDLRLTGQNYLSPRLDVNWGLRYGDLHDPRGSSVFISVPAPLNYTLSEAKARGGYGVEGAPGRFEVYAGTASKRYQNGGASALAYNLDSVNIGSTFYYRITPKTRLLFDVSQTNFKYPDGGSTLGNVERKYLMGATWDLLAATQGTVKAGYFTKKPDSSAMRDSKGLSLEGVVNWKPLTYTEFIGQASRAATEAAVGSAGFAISTGGGVTWNHAWRSYVKSALNVSRQETNFVGTTRTDKVTGVVGSVMYDLTRNLGLGMEYGYTKRDSTDPLYTYDQRRVMLKVAASL